MTKFMANDVIKGSGQGKIQDFFFKWGRGFSIQKEKQTGFVFYEIVKGMAATSPSSRSGSAGGMFPPGDFIC